MAARIRILQAIGGADFSWAPGDIVTLPDEQATVWADGERAELLAAGEGESSPAAASHLPPVVVGEDGRVLEVLTASVEPATPPQGQDEGAGWVRWAVTVRVPVSDPEPGPDADLYDPAGQSVKDVLAYLDGVGEEEAMRVLTLEENAETPRKGIVGLRGAILERAQANDERVERAAETSRGGGRGDVVETR